MLNRERPTAGFRQNKALLCRTKEDDGCGSVFVSHDVISEEFDIWTQHGVLQQPRREIKIDVFVRALHPVKCMDYGILPYRKSDYCSNET